MIEKTVFVIPCYNEEDNIENLINSCNNLVKQSNNNIDFILVNNGSQDSTGNLLSKIDNSNFYFVNIDKNIGMGNGILKGLEYAINLNKYQNYGWTHADLQIPPKSLIEASKLIISNSHSSEKIYIRGRRKNRNSFDIVFTFLMACYTSLVKRGLYYDITGLPALVSKNLINDILIGAPSGFAFDVFTYIKAKKAGAKIIRFNVNFGKRLKGKSSWNTGIKSKINMCKYYIKEIWRI